MKHFILSCRRPVVVALHVGLIIAANAFAFWLRFDGRPPTWAAEAFWQALPWLVAIRALTFVPFRLYAGLWRYTSAYDLDGLIGAVATSSVAFFVFTQTPLAPPVYPRSIVITDAILLTVLLYGIRMTRRIIEGFPTGRPGKRVLVFGAGDAGCQIVNQMIDDPHHVYRPVGLVDDNPGKVGQRIHGVRVLGTRHDIRRIVEHSRPAEVLIAIPRADAAAIRSLVRVLEPFKIPIKTLPSLSEMIDGRVAVTQIRGLAVEDLLTRAPVGLDRRPLKQLIAGRRVMVTGAGGSIGSELCRQILALKPATLVMFDRYENSLHAIRLELEDVKKSVGLRAVIGDVTDRERVNAVLDEHRPDIIFHAAAHKHVPLMEDNPCEAIKNNVRGTRVIAEAAEAHGVHRFIMISTDKAVNPTSVMGASKRVAELVVQAQAVGSGTSFSIVRFGNVLGSNGSVVPRFMDQIRRGGPVTITHPDMRRFFMLIPEAVQLVLHAASQAESGAAYVLEMGEQVKVVDMARDLIRLAGLVPDDDIKIEFIGLRPGEKLYEELIGVDEDASMSRVDKILCVRSRRAVSPDLLARVLEIESEAAMGRPTSMLAAIKELIGTFQDADASTTPVADTPAPVPQPASAIDFHGNQRPCPRCDAGRVRRAHARTAAERRKREITADRLFICGDCGWRGWLKPLPVSRQAPVGSVPDLTSLDFAIAAQPAVVRRSFSPRNLP